ncbi:ATP-dependent DNA ligase [Agromyces italicus]|uniref:ATP-dependent DNA ligase n=1 Tax=Agromyces italicus TaxID=279572 RepID=UPI0003B32257|nr:ATP-dependent DNA ligase [Agromyces italicus]
MADGERQLVEVDGRRLRLTNLDKVMYPESGMTKGEVISYYAEIAPVMLPHVAGRPITRKRWVHGVGTADAPESPFFEKTLADHAPDWIRRGVIEHSDGPKTYPIAGDRATLVWLAQQAALELHVPQWRFAPDGAPSNPDRMVFDLDPGPGMGLSECAAVARLVRDLVAGMGLAAMPVTSGSKGLHLYAELDGSQTSQQVSEVAHELARALEADHPELVVSSMRKSLRGGRVLIDWSQNNGKKTTIAPYSLRGRLRPTVAAPRSWEELEDPELRHLEAHEVLARIAEHGDPMAGLADATGPGPLATYLSMRREGRTPEPMPGAPGDGRAGEEPSFVIQEHHARRLHHDLRLERDGVLKSWAVPKGVPESSGKNHLAVQTEDHPIEYLDFEGTIPAGEYGAGSMTVWDTGTYAVEKWRDDEVIFTLTGSTGGPLGRVRLVLIRTDGSGEKSTWLLHRMKEQSVQRVEERPAQRVEERPTKEDTSRNSRDPGFETVAALPPQPARVAEKPMLATAGALGMLRGEDWVLEWKWDGIRALARVEGDRVRLLSRNGIDITVRYPELYRLPEAVDGDALLDGEIVALDAEGRPDFGVLQQRMGLTKPREIAEAAASVPVRLLLFDVLEAGGTPLVEEPYRVRRARLESLVRPRRGVPVEVPAPATGDAEDALEESRALGLEGLVAKRPGSVYRPGVRSDDWVKLKLTRTQEVVVGGYRRGVGSRAGRIRSLLVGIPAERDGADGEPSLEYVGRVGSGFRERELERLLARLDATVQPDAPFAEVPAADAADAVWVRPELVGEIEFSEWTGTGVARHPRWRGLRPDKSPDEVLRES